MEAVPASCLRDVWGLALQACVIGIDEGQFVCFHPTHFSHYPAHFMHRNVLIINGDVCLLQFQTRLSSVRKWPTWEKPS